MPDGHELNYSETQWVTVRRKDNAKSFIPSHRAPDGSVIYKAGSDPWPLWRERDAISHGSGQWIFEAEGEKCAEWITAAGLIAISQPGHDHRSEAIEQRYRRLADAGVIGVGYLADNDPTGETKAERCRDAADAVGLDFLLIRAIDVWPDLPKGGSIDDAPGNPSERTWHLSTKFRLALQALQRATQPPSVETSIAEVTAWLRDAIDQGVGGSELTQLIAELAAQSDQHFSVVEKIARSITEEHSNQLSLEAASQGIAAEADRIEIGSVLTAEFLLGPKVGGALDVITKYLPAEGPSAVLPFLTGIAGLVKLGTQVEGSAAASYRVPVNVYSALVAVSGGKKSPVGRLLVEGPSKTLELDLHQANRRAHENWREACRGVKKADQPDPPQPKRIRINEATGEALSQQLVNQEEAGLGLLVYRDELAGLFGSLNQYRGGKGADDEQLLETFDGGGLTSLRVGGARQYTRSQLSIYGSIQPAVLRDLLANGDDNGLWARFLFVPLPRRAVPLPMHTSPAEGIEVEHAKQCLAAIADRVYKRPPSTFQLASEASLAFRDYELDRQKAAQGADIPAQSALFGKSAGKVLRVAGLLHLVGLADGSVEGGMISKDCLDKACLLVDHLDAWALNLHADIATGGGDAWLAKVQEVALKAGTEITFRDVSGRLSKKQKKEFDPSRFGQVCRELAAAGYGEVSEGARGALKYRATKELPR